MPERNEKVDTDVVKAIKKTSEKFGQLYPVLIDSNEITIDGIHRQVAIDNPTTFKVEKIKTKRDRLEARLVANHARKGQHKSTWVPTLSELGKILEREGVEKIGMKIAEETGLPYRTIMRHLPDKFKNKAQAQRASHPRLQNGNRLKIEKPSAESLVESPAKTKSSKLPTQPANEILEYKLTSEEKPRPRITVQKYSNQPWKAIIVPKDFLSKLEKACERKNINLEEAITLALMRLLEDLRSKKGCLQKMHR